MHYDAVAVTSGQVLVYNDNVIYAFYVAGAIPGSSSCVADPDYPGLLRVHHGHPAFFTMFVVLPGTTGRDIQIKKILDMSDGLFMLQPVENRCWPRDLDVTCYTDRCGGSAQCTDSGHGVLDSDTRAGG